MPGKELSMTSLTQVKSVKHTHLHGLNIVIKYTKISMNCFIINSSN